MELLAPPLTSDNGKLKQETWPDLGRTILRMPLTANVIAFGNDGIITQTHWNGDTDLCLKQFPLPKP